jgi:hypothetical protein
VIFEEDLRTIPCPPPDDCMTVEEALAALGKTMPEVAESLTAGGWCGKPLDACKCPVAMHCTGMSTGPCNYSPYDTEAWEADFASRPTEPPLPAPTTIPAPPPSDGLCPACDGTGLVLERVGESTWTCDGFDSVACMHCLDGRAL